MNSCYYLVRHNPNHNVHFQTNPNINKAYSLYSENKKDLMSIDVVLPIV